MDLIYLFNQISMPKGTRFLPPLPCMNGESATRRAASSRYQSINDSGGVFAHWLHLEFIEVISLQWQWQKNQNWKKTSCRNNFFSLTSVWLISGKLFTPKMSAFINNTSTGSCISSELLLFPSVRYRPPTLCPPQKWIQSVSRATLFCNIPCHLAPCVTSEWVKTIWSLARSIWIHLFVI